MPYNDGAMRYEGLEGDSEVGLHLGIYGGRSGNMMGKLHVFREKLPNVIETVRLKHGSLRVGQMSCWHICSNGRLHGLHAGLKCA